MRRVACLVAATLLVGAADATADDARSADATGAGTAVSKSPEPARARELMRLLRQDCGACHGMRLTGGLGPALTPEALATKPATSLVATIVAGRPGTAMPPWRRFVSEAEAHWLVARMVAGDLDVRD